MANWELIGKLGGSEAVPFSAWVVGGEVAEILPVDIPEGETWLLGVYGYYDNGGSLPASGARPDLHLGEYSARLGYSGHEGHLTEAAGKTSISLEGRGRTDTLRGIDGWAFAIPLPEENA